MKNKIIIQGILPNQNDIISANKLSNKYNRYKPYSKMKSDNTELVAWCCKGSKKYKNKIDLDITFYEPNKKRDKDNVISGGLKFILDGLVLSSVIKNDGWKDIGEIISRVELDRNNPRIEIEIKES